MSSHDRKQRLFGGRTLPAGFFKRKRRSRCLSGPGGPEQEYRVGGAELWINRRRDCVEFIITLDETFRGCIGGESAAIDDHDK